MRFLVYAVVALAIALSSLTSLAQERSLADMPRGWRSGISCYQGAHLSCQSRDRWSEHVEVTCDARTDGRCVRGSVQPVADVEPPRMRFIPICESVGADPAVVECIPLSSVQSEERKTLWTYATRQLLRCPIVVLDPDRSPTSDNLGFQCDGVITKAGVIADDVDE